MPPQLQQFLDLVTDVLKAPPPSWVFLLAAALYFGLTHLRPILADRRKAAAAKTDQQNKNKEEIGDRLHKAKLLVDETEVLAASITDDASMVASNRGRGTSMEVREDLYMSLVQTTEEQLCTLAAYRKQLSAVDEFDGSHDNLLKTRALCQKIERVNAKVENERVDVHNQVQMLMHGL